MVRKQNWSILLAEQIEKYRNCEFKRGVIDCAVFTGECIDLMTGSDFTSEFRQEFATKEKAYEFIKSKGYINLSDIADDKLGQVLPSPAYAQRGDCIYVVYEDHEALAIVDLSGRRAVSINLEGLAFYDPEHWVKAWRV